MKKKTLCVTVLCTIIMCTKVRAVSMGWSTLSGFDLSWFCGFGFSSWNFSNMAPTHGSRWGSGLGPDFRKILGRSYENLRKFLRLMKILGKTYDNADFRKILRKT